MNTRDSDFAQRLKHIDGIADCYPEFLPLVDKICQQNAHMRHILWTQLTILLEGFYLAVKSKVQPIYDEEGQDINKSKEHIANKHLLTGLRHFRAHERWSSHFGTPTVNFLLTYPNQLFLTQAYFLNPHAQTKSKIAGHKPWEDINLGTIGNLIWDEINWVMVNPHAAIFMEPADETDKDPYKLRKTMNPFGGFTTKQTNRFISRITDLAQSGDKVLIIGGADGIEALPLLRKGVSVYVNDICEGNLGRLKLAYDTDLLSKHVLLGPTAMGDIHQRIIYLPGEFPEELEVLPKNAFKFIIIQRVMHFLPPARFAHGLELLMQCLAYDGILYGLNETPFLENFKTWCANAMARKARGDKHYEVVLNPDQCEESRLFAGKLPKDIMCFLDDDALDRYMKELKENDKRNYVADYHREYVDQTRYPEVLRGSHKESLAFVVRKREKNLTQEDTPGKLFYKKIIGPLTEKEKLELDKINAQLDALNMAEEIKAEINTLPSISSVDPKVAGIKRERDDEEDDDRLLDEVMKEQRLDHENHLQAANLPPTLLPPAWPHQPVLYPNLYPQHILQQQLLQHQLWQQYFMQHFLMQSQHRQPPALQQQPALNQQVNNQRQWHGQNNSTLFANVSVRNCRSALIPREVEDEASQVAHIAAVQPPVMALPMAEPGPSAPVRPPRLLRRNSL